jgi:P-type Cu+ transporter
MTHLDPVCGMTIEEEDAVGSYEHHGVMYYFCNPSCLERFKGDPKQFLEGREAHAAPLTTAGARFLCPMDPEVRASKPGACPKCGMALEPDLSDATALTRTDYTCPMHPEIVRVAPGSCPICGMALEPRTVTLLDTPNPELLDMTRRFRIAALLAAPVFLVTMYDMATGGSTAMTRGPVVNWLELVLATPVVFWAGWPFFERAWASIVNRSPNMFTLIALGVGAAYGYSALGTVAPGLFPSGLSDARRGRDVL